MGSIGIEGTASISIFVEHPSIHRMGTAIGALVRSRKILDREVGQIIFLFSGFYRVCLRNKKRTLDKLLFHVERIRKSGLD